MNHLYQAKFKELFIEFTRFLVEHPEVAGQIPRNAHVVLLDSHDPIYSLQAIRFAEQAQHTDDLPNRPVVYVEVKEMAPVRSRLQEVDILTKPPAYAAA